MINNKILFALFFVGILLTSLVLTSITYYNSENLILTNGQTTQNKLDALQGDTIGIKENVEIIKTTSENEIKIISDDDIFNDKVSITDSVSLVIHHNIVTPIINNVVAIFDRIFEKQKLEINKKVLDNFVADTKYQYTTSFVQETDLIVLQLNDVQTNYIFENIINKNLENINLDFSFLILLAPFSTLLIFNLENIRIRKTNISKSFCK